MGRLLGIGKTVYNDKNYSYNDVTGLIPAPPEFYGGRVKYFGTTKDDGVLLVLERDTVIDIYLDDDVSEYVPKANLDVDDTPLVDTMTRVELIKYAKELEVEGNIATMGSIKLKMLIKDKLNKSN